MWLPYGWLVHLNKGYFQFKSPPDDPVAYSRWEFEEGKKVWEKFFDSRVNLESKDVIDVGCGPGGKTCYLATRGPNRVAGVDFDPKLIRDAELAMSVLIPPEDRIRAEFVVADASDLPFPDEYFDIATCSDAFEHFPDPQNVMKEVARILKTGGLFCIDFAQFYSWNGHHLRDFFRTPWVHVFWSSDDILKAVREFSKEQRLEIQDLDLREKLDEMVGRRLEQWGNGLNRMSLGEFEKLLINERRLKIKYCKKTAKNPLMWPLIFVPGIRELAVARNVYILKRV
ncbi:MAG: class I SAM-dependent methyltransferase [bacterium]|nr:class I SAM-dependent methyltransferase [bacterium]